MPDFPFSGFVSTENHMYLFEGRDYSKEPSKEDRKSFEQLVNLQKTLLEKTSHGGRSLRNKGSVRAVLFYTSMSSSNCCPKKAKGAAGVTSVSWDGL